MSDGSASVSITGGGAAALGSAWTSSPIAVQAGETYDLAMTVTTQSVSSGPAFQVVYTDALGKVLGTASAITTTVTGTAAMTEILGRITVPAGVTSLQVKLVGFAATDLSPSGTVWFDDIWLW